MFVQRMLKDPAFAAKVKEQQLIAASKGQNADPNVVDEATAQRYLDEDEAAPVSYTHLTLPTQA